jgi:hypothetical protein
MDKAKLDNLPYLVVEELIPGARISSVFSGVNNVPLAVGRIKVIKRVHAIQFAYRGCYIAKNLGSNPHYTVKKEVFGGTIRQRCLDEKIPLKMYASSNVVAVLDLLMIFNFDKEENGASSAVTASNDEGRTVNDKHMSEINDTPQGYSETVEELKRLLDELRICDIWISDNEPNNNTDKVRGPIQQHYGFSSNYSLSRLSKEKGGMCVPAS